MTISFANIAGGGNNSHVASGRIGDPEADAAAALAGRRRRRGGVLLSLAWIVVAVVAGQPASTMHARLACMMLLLLA